MAKLKIKQEGRIDEKTYIPLTDQQVREITDGLLDGRVFGSWMVAQQDRHLVPTIFMTVFTSDTLQKRMDRAMGIVEWFGLRAHTLAARVGGYPVFTHARGLDRTDLRRILSHMPSYSYE